EARRAGGDASDSTRSAPLPAVYPSGTEVRHEQWGEGTVLSEEPDRVTVLFTEAGYRTLSLEALAERDDLLTVLSRPGEDRPGT
ncbi:DUF3553 domain-containing protein, partial [Streptomyces sp. SID2955]|nr:DUF3553 domain-containing protein [Streptomyces sp. SID2955]